MIKIDIGVRVADSALSPVETGPPQLVDPNKEGYRRERMDSRSASWL